MAICSVEGARGSHTQNPQNSEIHSDRKLLNGKEEKVKSTRNGSTPLNYLLL